MKTETNRTANERDLEDALRAGGFEVAVTPSGGIQLRGVCNLWPRRAGWYIEPISHRDRATTCGKLAAVVRRCRVLREKRDQRARLTAEREARIAAEKPIKTSAGRMTVEQARALVAELNAALAAHEAE